jgi:hypothetical protein
MSGSWLQKYNLYSTAIRVWFFLALSMVIVVFIFPVHLKLWESEGSAPDTELSFRDFLVVLGANALAGAVIAKVRPWSLFLLSAILTIVLANWVAAWVFSIHLRFQ